MPTQVAKIYPKVLGGVTDNTLILNTRCQLVYPISAPNWVDLRVGFFLSVCSTAADDPASPITGLGETMVLGSPPEDHYWIGIKTNNDSLPLASNTSFIGFTGHSPNTGATFTSELVSSDGAIGGGTTFWRPRTKTSFGQDTLISAGIFGNAGILTFNNVQQHFAQVWDGTITHPYATLLMLRIIKSLGTGNPITVQIKQGTNSSDILFTNTPTQDLLEANLAAYPTTVQSHTVNNMTNIPDAIYLYWPFHNSRLRIHALGFMKFR